MTFSKKLNVWLVFGIIALLFSYGLTNAQIKIMPLGDSITKGAGSSDNGGYRDDLQLSLTSYSVNYNFVGSLSDGSGFQTNHEGHEGFTSGDILSNVSGWLTTFSPNYVLLIVGANDVTEIANETLTIANSVNNIEGIVNAIHSHNASTHILISSLTPRTDALDSLTTALSHRIKYIYEDKKAAGYKIHYIGTGEMFRTYDAWGDDYMEDFLHPNDNGYNVIAKGFFHRMINIIQEANSGLNRILIDNFDRQTTDLLDVWAHDGTYEIQVVSGKRELHCNASDGNWSHMAIYRGATNAGEISFKWGAGTAASDIIDAGVAVRLNTANPNTAKGYFIRFKKEDGSNVLQLWTINNGGIGNYITESPYAISPPAAGDVCKIVLDSDANGHKFECYFRDEYAGYVNDPNKVYGNVAEQFAGILSKGSGSSYNVDDYDMYLIGDIMPPSNISNLNATSVTSTSITLTWTSPGDDGIEGRASYYDIRYSENMIDETNWSQATVAPGLPFPAEPNTTENFVLAGLSPATDYYFGIKTADDAFNWSGISNVKQASTSSGGGALMKSDDFNDPGTLTTLWSAHPAYAIQNGQLMNMTGSGWGQLAVFKSNVNPVEASLQWAAEPGADLAGIDKAGIAMMLDSDNYATANGYLCTVRNEAGANPVCYLFTVVEGAASGLVGTLQVPGSSYPGPGDMFKIVVSSDGSGHHFDYFVNEQYYGRLDDPAKTHTDDMDYYAGIQLYGGLNNNVDRFTVLNAVGEPKYLQKVSPLTDPIGIVGKALEDSLVVQVIDNNYNPVSNLVVDFSVKQGNATLDLSPPDNNIRRETENANLIQGEFQEGVDPNAAGGRYVYCSGSGQRFMGKIEFSVYIKTPGQYLMYGRFNIPDKNLYSVFVQVDDQPDITQDTVAFSIGVWDLPKTTANQWIWDFVSDRSSGNYKVWNLSQGVHKITITQRWCPEVKLDKIILSNNFSFWPSGTEEYPEYSTDTNGRAKAELTLGTTAGLNEVEVTVPGYSLEPSAVNFTITGRADTPTTMTATTAQSQTGKGGERLSSPFEVQLKDKYSNLAEGYTVKFEITEGSGTLSNGQTIHEVETDNTGKASTFLTLGTESANNTVKATFPGLPVINFTATATTGLAEVINKISGDGQSGIANSTLADPLVVKIVDNVGDPVKNHKVNFAVVEGGGTLSPATSSAESNEIEGEKKVNTLQKTNAQSPTSGMDVYTDNDGYARVRFKLGPSAGLNRVTASSEKAGVALTNSPVEFSATGEAGEAAILELVSGTPQTGAAGMPLSMPFVAKVTDESGNGKVGYSVHFEVVQGGGSLNPPGPGWLTEANGVVSVTLTLGDEEGLVNIVRASAEKDGTPLQNSPIDFQATAGSISAMERVGAENYTGSAGWLLTDSLKVLVLNNYDQPVGGFPITWKCIGNNLGTVNGEIQANVNSNSQGISAVEYICGMIPGVPSQVEARVDGLSGSPIVFNISVAGVDAIQPVAGNYQTGTVGEPLQNPLKVKVVDDQGRAIPNYEVTYTVTQGGGKVNGSSTIDLLTTSEKTAEAIFTLGPEPGTNNHVVEVTAMRKGAEILENGSLDQWESGNPVNWQKYASDAESNVAEDEANARSGKCVRFFSKNTSSVVNIHNKNVISVKSNTTYEFSFWAKTTTAGATILSRMMHNSNYLNPQGTWQTADSDWLSLTLQPGSYKKYSIIFTTPSGMTQIGADNLKIIGKGTNSIIYVDDVSLVEKNAEGDIPLNGSPVTFNASATIGAPDSLVAVSGDSQYVVVGNQLENPLTVMVADKCGNPIVGHDVIFEVKAGGGYLDGKSDVTMLTKTTNDSGKAQVALTVGTAKGEYNNIVEARSQKTTGGSLINSPFRFYASARSSSADKLVKISGDGQQNAVVRQKLAQPFVVKVIDKKGNGVEGHPVQFSIVTGGGTFNAVDGDTAVSIITNYDGVVSVDYYPGPQAFIANVVFAQSWNGPPELNDSPMDFTVTPKSGPASPTASRIHATGPVPADGQSQSQVTITLTDNFGNPIPDKAVTINASGSNNMITQPGALTDENGQTSGAIASTRAELKNITARNVSDGIDLITNATVRFRNLDASNISGTVGTDQQGNYGTALKNPIKCYVRDRNGNAVNRHPVYFEAYVGGGQIYDLNKNLVREGESIMTDSSGAASAYWVLGPSEEVNRARANSEGLSGEPRWIATAHQGQASSLVKVSGDEKSGTAGYTLSEPFVVKVIDENGDPIRDYPVRYTSTFGDGTFTGRSSVTLPTDPFGDASVHFTLGRGAGINQAQAIAENLPSTNVQYFSAVGNSGDAAKILKVSGDGRTGTVGGTLSGITVKVTDLYDNVYREGFDVQFGILSGNATIAGEPIVTTGANGSASVVLNLGTTRDDIVVQAYADGLINNPLKFEVSSKAASPVSMAIHSGNNQDGTIGRELVYPLEVLVVDTYNNPASNVGISFVMSGGGNGTLLTPQMIYTDDDGIAAARLKLGTAENIYKVKAINNSLDGNGLEFVANGVTNLFPLFQNLNKEVTATENQTISFTVNATDEDDFAVSYQAYNLPPGATFDASGSQRFGWTPNYQQAGEYEVNFVARDNRGGLDDEAVKITVLNSNRRPSIFSYQPMQDLLVGHRNIGETFHFSITVADQDTDDEIKYEWYYNEVLVSTNQQYSFYVNDEKVDLGNHTVTVIASDGYDSVQRSWDLAIKTPVELATFSAEVVGRDGVHLAWSTNYETNNAGFNILRATAANGQYSKINENMIPANENKVYEFRDTKVKVGETYYYKLEDISINGVRTEHEAIKIHVAKPDKFELSQNFPNPFNPSTKIYYQLADPAFVKLTVYNLLGQEVITLVSEDKDAGYHVAMWNGIDKHGTQMASGIYYYRIVAGSFVQAKKMVLIK